jgi:hypothetical protein
MPRLPAVRVRSSAYGFAVLNDRGRIAARSVLGVLGWVPGTRVVVRERGGLVVVTADGGGAARLTPEGHLRVPASARRWCGLRAGSEVLLVADPAEQRLVIHPAALLDAMVTVRHAEVFGGEAP